MIALLTTLALATGGYTLAAALRTSGPLALVVAGLFIGNRGRHFAMSDETRAHRDIFWELIDAILNAVHRIGRSCPAIIPAPQERV